jgi:hypothetical protein
MQYHGVTSIMISLVITVKTAVLYSSTVKRIKQSITTAFNVSMSIINIH